MIRLTAVIELEGQAPRALTHESNTRQVTIGRDASADFQIPLTTVSRQHARISETDGVWVLEDLGSTHGTMVNGRKLEPGEKKVLRHGDVIELTHARITCNIEYEKVTAAELGEGTQAIAARAIDGILGRLGEAHGEDPFLRVLNGPDEGQRFSFQGTISEWTLGRSKDCEFVLNDPNVSRRHATVKKDWSGFTVHDHGSKNGVMVNEGRIKKARRLKDRDEITVGPIKLVFIDPNADLLSALKDVPGFGLDEPSEVEDFEADPSVMGAPNEDEAEAGGENEALDADGLAAHEGEGFDAESGTEDDAGQGNDDSGDAEYDSIDPELLKVDESKLPFEWLIVGGVGTMVVAAALLLFLILS